VLLHYPLHATRAAGHREPKAHLQKQASIPLAKGAEGVSCVSNSSKIDPKLTLSSIYIQCFTTLLEHLRKYGIFVAVAVRLQSKRKGVAAKDLIPIDSLYGFELSRFCSFFFASLRSDRTGPDFKFYDGNFYPIHEYKGLRRLISYPKAECLKRFTKS